MSHSIRSSVFVSLPLDARIRIVAAELVGWRYGTGDDVCIPRQMPGLPMTANLAAKAGRKIDCSSLTSFVLTCVYPRIKWTMEDYADLQIYDKKRPFSPIEVIDRHPIGGRVARPIKYRWHLMQTWKTLTPLKSGHARLVYALDADRLLVLESTNAAGKIGPRWAELSWADISSRYDGAKLALLEE